ncbi:Peptidoglycan binding-like [Dillenia turbinata]|uniref:Peptidoglycan binding-like n=1 Tax=Dillenia turbinata TaxID=194707 RepID=A0AAN8V7F3_9MAGN
MALTNPSFEVLCIIVFFFIFPNIVHSQKQTPPPDPFEVFEQLEGYHKGPIQASTSSNEEQFDEVMESAVKPYQQFYGWNITGYLDSDTVKEMIQFRCGVPDIIIHEHTHHNFNEHFAFFPRKQNFVTLESYTIAKKSHMWNRSYLYTGNSQFLHYQY